LTIRCAGVSVSSFATCDIEPVDPTRTEFVLNTSNGFKMSKLFLEARLRQMQANGIDPNLKGLGASSDFLLRKDP
jgi:hypothetical protein